MRIYFSGGGGLKETPEVLTPERKPHIMLTFFDLDKRQSSAVDRLKAHLRNKKRNETRKR